MSSLTSNDWKTILKFDTKLYADIVEFCPFPQHQDLVCIGTYQLNEETKQREGGIYLFSTSQAKPCFFLSGVGALDLKFSSNRTQQIGVAQAGGGLALLQLVSNDSGKQTLKRQECLNKKHSSCSELIALSCDWSVGPLGKVNEVENERVAVSYTDGELCIFENNVDGETKQLQQWKAHDYESWIVAFDRHNRDVLFSGSDDCMLKGWDLRCSTAAPIFRKRFSMGVTTIQSNPHRSNQIIVGSYDESIRLFDQRSTKTPLKSVESGGGVWRLKWHPTKRSKILAACMRGGFHVIDNDDAKAMSIYASYEGPHDISKLAYGADWSYTSTNMIGTCSFYDHLFSLSEISDSFSK